MTGTGPELLLAFSSKISTSLYLVSNIHHPEQLPQFSIGLFRFNSDRKTIFLCLTMQWEIDFYILIGMNSSPSCTEIITILNSMM